MEKDKYFEFIFLYLAAYISGVLWTWIISTRIVFKLLVTAFLALIPILYDRERELITVGVGTTFILYLAGDIVTSLYMTSTTIEMACCLFGVGHWLYMIIVSHKYRFPFNTILFFAIVIATGISVYLLLVYSVHSEFVNTFSERLIMSFYIATLMAFILHSIIWRNAVSFGIITFTLSDVFLFLRITHVSTLPIEIQMWTYWIALGFLTFAVFPKYK